MLAFYSWTGVLRRVMGLSGGLLIVMCSFSFFSFFLADIDVFFFFFKQFYVFYILTMDFCLK